MRRIIILFSFVLLFLTGCGTLEVELEKDGSGTAIFTMPLDEVSYSEEALMEEIQSGVEQANERAGENVLESKGMKTKDDKMIAKFEFDHISALHPDSLLVSFSDMARYNPYQMERLSPVDEEEEFDHEAEAIQDLPVYYFTELNPSVETTLELPGEVKYVSHGVSLVEGEKDKVTLQNSSGYIVYEPSSFSLIGILIILLVVAGAGGWFFMTRKREKQQSVWEGRDVS
ncbi:MULTISPECIES: hypothetical protein [Pontibacillus]|uniref:LPXTG-motif cell wall-anchored protein n=1 Tax=Pontibacillus chungwhensis TaxID=265426 RepID=A0ABY8UWG0_9BACI|nr:MULTISPECIES: hypothetical protein [Pontibacillus]MCD5324183.1 hypothetical protein [Pontibacillus sp. HN14]WIF97758.1 hypothetical protein QNI29_18850 [Pontibacillus chungwhensis]